MAANCQGGGFDSVRATAYLGNLHLLVPVLGARVHILGLATKAHKSLVRLVELVLVDGATLFNVFFKVNENILVIVKAKFLKPFVLLLGYSVLVCVKARELVEDNWGERAQRHLMIRTCTCTCKCVHDSSAV